MVRSLPLGVRVRLFVCMVLLLVVTPFMVVYTNATYHAPTPAPTHKVEITPVDDAPVPTTPEGR